MGRGGKLLVVVLVSSFLATADRGRRSGEVVVADSLQRRLMLPRLARSRILLGACNMVNCLTIMIVMMVWYGSMVWYGMVVISSHNNNEGGVCLEKKRPTSESQ